MQTLEQTVLEYSVREFQEDTAVVIVAAGSSNRMKGINKIFMPILNTPVIVRTINAFYNAGFNNIIVVTKQEDILKMQNILDNYEVLGVTDIVEGGTTRSESVLKGISKINNKKYVLIHDGARPLVKEKDILRVKNALNSNNAAALATLVTDTIKEIDQNGFIINTINREKLLAMQTPQGFLLEEYKKACNMVDITNLTDDCAIMEAAGHKIYPVITDKENIKITTKEDIILAETILKERGEK